MTMPPPGQQPMQPQTPTNYTVVNAPPTNGLGLAGFITSLVGIVTCGVLSPVGLLLSLIGLLKSPRGFAVAGTVLGLIGSVWAVVAGIGIVMGLLGLSRAAKTIADYANAHTSARQAYLQIDQQRRQGGAALTTADADAIAKRFNDPFGTPFRAEVRGNQIFITSAGRDKKFDTSD